MTDQRAEFVALARDFAQNELAPHGEAWDQAKAFPTEVVQRLGELGFFGLLTPEAYDGLAIDALTYVMMLEELAAGDASVAITLSVHNSLPSYLLRTYGTSAQCETWLRPMARGEYLAAFSVSEPDSGSDLAAASARAERVGDGWRLNGAKAWVTSGSVADLALVLLRTSNHEKPSHGLSFFLVPLDAAGVEVAKTEDKMGLRASPTNQIALTDVRVGDDALVGEEGAGFRYAMEGLDHGRLGVAAQAIGIGRAALEHARAYAAERHQFEQPIRSFQGVGFMLADMATRLAAARALLHDAARAVTDGGSLTLPASMAKLFASETAMFVTNKAVQIFGGYGYMRDYPVERLLRDAKVTEIYEGTSEVQRMVIARGLYRNA